MSTYSRVYAFLFKWWWLTFLLMGVNFVMFGLMSLNLLYTLGANLEFLGMHGIDAVREGGLMQLFGLIFMGYAAALFYVLFKLCEKVLVERLCATKSKGIDS
jgi:hypothetical protein